VLGVSPDSPKSHRKFKLKFQLPYTLIADEDHVVSEKYGVWAEKSMYGRKYWGVLRTTFNQSFGTINAANLKKAHALLESGQSRGKIVLEGW